LKFRRIIMVLIAVVPLTLSSFGNQVFVTDYFEETVHNGIVTTIGGTNTAVYFPGRSSNWTLDIELEVSGRGIDIVVRHPIPTREPLFEAYGVTSINVTIMLELGDFSHIRIRITWTHDREVTMAGHIIASCIYERRIVSLLTTRFFGVVSIAVFGLLVIDITVGGYRSRNV